MGMDELVEILVEKILSQGVGRTHLDRCLKNLKEAEERILLSS